MEPFLVSPYKLVTIWWPIEVARSVVAQRPSDRHTSPFETSRASKIRLRIPQWTTLKVKALSACLYLRS